MKQITVDWLDHVFMEKPWVKFLEWLNQGFPIPKKAKTPKLPWRGWPICEESMARANDLIIIYLR